MSERYFQSAELAAAVGIAKRVATDVIGDAERFRSADEVFDACREPLEAIGAALFCDHRLRYWSFLRDEKAENAMVFEAAIIICAVGVAVEGQTGVFWVQAAEIGRFAEVLDELDAGSIAKDSACVAGIFARQRRVGEDCSTSSSWETLH